VSSQTSAVITGNFNATRTATLTVNPSGPVARFTVSGASGTDVCRLINNGNAFDCTFNGSASTAPGFIIAWDWAYTIAGAKSETTSGPTLNPNPNCGLFPPAPLPAGTTSFNMTVSLKVRDNVNVESAVATNNNVRVLPQGVCGF
jgi:hypothetical protein